MWSVDRVQTYCINLDRRPDRWAEVKSQPAIKRMPNLQRFPAVDGKTLSIETDTRISTLARYNIMNHTRRSHDMLDTIGGVGCALSHISLWTKLANSSENVFLILEDDILASDAQWDAVRMLFSRESQLADSTTWDIWSVGRIHCFEQMGVKPADRHVVEDKWLRCQQFVGLNAYFISKTGAQKLLEDVYPIQQHIDWYITYYAQTKPFTILHNKLANFKQRLADSDIAIKDQCVICDIPSTVETSHYVVPMDKTNAAILTALSIAFVIWVSLASKSRRR
jgi:GR25 family glycosyltransferase involved in LPS biosynthesis